MQRVTISIEDDLAHQFDALIARQRYQNRSEAVRDLVRRALETDRLEQNEARHCVASLSYVYNHHERALASRLTQAQHERHDLSLAATHVHLDHDNCLETLILRGETRQVREFAAAITGQRGVRHGLLNLVPVQLRGYRQAGHTHAQPNT
jgi:CopG family transcriptional regulator, nickel-responsive regulator